MRHRRPRGSTGGDGAIVEALQHDYVRCAGSLCRVRDIAVDDPAPVHPHVNPAEDPRVAHKRGRGCRPPKLCPSSLTRIHLAPLVSERKIPWSATAHPAPRARNTLRSACLPFLWTLFTGTS